MKAQEVSSIDESDLDHIAGGEVIYPPEIRRPPPPPTPPSGGHGDIIYPWVG